MGCSPKAPGGSGGDGGFAVSGSISKSASINFAMGGTGGDGGKGGLATIVNSADLMTSGDGAHGILAQSLGGGGGSGGVACARIPCSQLIRRTSEDGDEKLDGTACALYTLWAIPGQLPEQRLRSPWIMTSCRARIAASHFRSSLGSASR